jgi:S-DNA-T family DNA segregation ATPase FtsK/SpoIIIE
VRAADVFLVVDNWGAARSEMEEIEAAVLDIANRGLGVGVHVVLTANRWADIRLSLRDSISARLELRLNDPTESEVHRKGARQLTSAPPGRGMAPQGVQYQVALPRVDGMGTAEGLSDAVDDALTKLAMAWRGTEAPAVRMLPGRVTAAELAVPEDSTTPGVPVGIAETDLAPVYVDMNDSDPHFLVFGDPGSGKSEFLRTWMRGLAARRSDREIRFVVVDYRRSLLGVVPDSYIGAYAGDAKAARTYAQSVAAKLAERLPPATVTMEQLRERSWWTGPEIYLVVDDYDLVSSNRQSPVAALADYLPQSREVGFHVVAARRVAGLMRTQMGEPLLNLVRELGASGLVLSGDSREGVVLGSERAAQRPPGRGVLVRRRHAPVLIQVALER